MEGQTRARATDDSQQRWKAGTTQKIFFQLTLISFPLMNVWNEEEGEWKPYNGSTVKLY